MTSELYNEQTIHNARISAGTWKIYIDPYVEPTELGVTPTTELGYADNVTFNPSAEHIELWNATPQMLDEVFVGKESASLEFDCPEDFYRNYLHVISTGICDTTGDGSMGQGGLTTTNKVMILMIHDLIEGNRMSLNLWRCVGAGTLPITKSRSATANEPNMYRMAFKVMKQKTISGSMTDWGNTELAKGRYLYHLAF